MLLCNPWIIDLPSCLCADKRLLIRSIACVQWLSYWTYFLLVCNRTIIGNQSLLMCRPTFIKLFDCLYAIARLLKSSIAYVQAWNYWFLQLLICNKGIIDFRFCFGASQPLLMPYIACVQMYRYWLTILLVCNGVIIESIFCLYAIANLFIRFVAYVY